MALQELNISDGTVLSFDYNTVNFDGNWRFGVRENIRISVTKIKCGGETVPEGAIGDQAKALDDLIATQDYIALTINGHTFEKPFQLTGFSLDEGDWLLATSGTLEFQSFHEGNADIGELEDYVGWDLTDSAFFENFSDEFNFKREANGTSYSHNISIKFAAINPVNGKHITPPLTAGLALAQNLITIRPEFLWLKEPQLQGIYTDIGLDCKRLITESVDEINNTVNVTETFNAQNIKNESSCLYSFSAQQSIERNEEGIINASENGTVINLRLGENNKRADPEDCLTQELAAATQTGGRLDKIFDHYKEQLALEADCETEIPPLVRDSGGELILIEKGIVRDPFRGKATYSIKGTNDPKIKEKAIHEYTITIEAINYDPSSVCLPFVKVSRQGSFIGNDPEGRNMIIDNGQEVWLKYDRAKEAWDDEYPAIKQDAKDCAEVAENSYPVSLSNTHSKYKGRINYKVEYSTEPQYGTTDTPYKLWTYNYQDDETAEGGDCLFQHTLQNVANQDQGLQVLQTRNTTILPNSSMTQRMVGKRTSTIKELTTAMITKATPKSDGPKTVKDCNYSFNPENNITVDATFSWE